MPAEPAAPRGRGPFASLHPRIARAMGDERESSEYSINDDDGGDAHACGGRGPGTIHDDGRVPCAIHDGGRAPCGTCVRDCGHARA